ncbi:guanidinobutyrase-like [Halichondria panicea]|uniref:guanidinobutyrase-like n=1 Tax=Halichondria panicea TaxID=6063 RepID=UPI00312B58FE
MLCSLRASLRLVCRQNRRLLHNSTGVCQFNKPVSGYVMPRSGGIATTFRLPLHENSPQGLDACFVGIPMDTGASNRSGTRLGPRHIRYESVLIRALSMSGTMPFDSLQVADIGDVPIVPYNIQRSCDIITDYYNNILKADCTPLTMGGDHTLTYPILRAIKEKYGAVGLIQVDAHLDLEQEMMGEPIAHGTPFRRALDEELIDPTKMFQIGLRGSLYVEEEIQEEFVEPQKLGIRMVLAEDCWHRSLEPLMAKIRQELGDTPVYLSFDIDGIDPSCCPGTGTPEVAGLTPIQGMEIVRGCRGLNLIGADVVEVNPLYDPSGVTANMAANLLFEMLCVLPGVKYTDPPTSNFDF